MRKVFSFGKFAVDGKRKTNEIQVEIELDEENGLPRFSAMGEIWNAGHTDIIHGGQCLDMLNEYLFDNETFKTIYGLWERNHLNDMDPCANDAQREAVREYCEKNPYDYEGVCEYLRGKNLFEVVVNGKSCKYGHEWYYRDIPEEDMKTIRRLLTTN